ncbi:MAG TPA: hypothetical protein VFB99_02975, partial [Vicinamibacterales bacterium]|nr:hypothetical protein [Vicinamibacterales bacterium]
MMHAALVWFVTVALVVGQVPRGLGISVAPAAAEVGGSDFSDTTGGFTEEYTDTDAREQDDIDPTTFLPAGKGKFTFPAP